MAGKRCVYGEPDLDKAGADAFVLVTSKLHTELDKFKEEHKQYTKRGFSMLPVNELLITGMKVVILLPHLYSCSINHTFSWSVQKLMNFVTGLKWSEKHIMCLLNCRII